MKYEWDLAKDAENRSKHKLSLADGIPALEDPDAHDPDSPPIATDTDWAAVDAMSPAEIHEAALADVDAQPLPERELAGMTKLVNIKKLRERICQTQEVFAATYHIPIGTLRDWEQRRKHPDAPARAYLQVIAQNPEAVAAMLRSAA